MMFPRRVATLDLPYCTKEIVVPSIGSQAQMPLRDAEASLRAFRALKRTAKFMPSLRDEESANFAQKMRIMTRILCRRPIRKFGKTPKT
jgi:hypothetical protein